MPNVYTRTGDKGSTGLFGGSRISKDDVRIEAYGTMDEAQAFIGLAASLTKDEEIRNILLHIEERIYVLEAELASDDRGKNMLKDKVEQSDIDQMEKQIDHYLQIVGKQTKFVIPGRNPASAALHTARAVVRRGERRIVTYEAQDPGLRPEVVKFVNRLSDLLFTLARVEEFEQDIRDVAEKGMKDQDQVSAGAVETSEDDNELLLVLAKRAAAGARVKARELGVPIVFSAVDRGGNLAYYERMKDSLIASIDISQNKAFTANALKCPTEDIQDLAKEGSPLFGIQFTNQNRIVTFGGGYPLIVDGKQIGAIGVSGGTADEDMAIAKAGLAVLQNH
ncbi:cob(I)yrinic acid a,c-diamide adenosyltransferase [Pseudoramibacter sp.]|jgi:ATP:cob(I)alamin adenosyltransferase|uniref:cob(I)yrinic acid a,c-diamide adenosyltransferase n=1 Tax=Pseudoramibacter sp. TaxID=2034862 RepID=UPI0026013767|nr:cob(I)yrinic acid a,c-diamide adenosyltransferase [Pseudoramibacter sp.]MCH4072007.1 cob(I)yrinic acid a,c-diamide adenosyltransferase [Pseudoramibacter sp.]MCH4105776.1 cob(I)yrinic acid a,c-diamide adenosyltransferase [Pseudoramibacter sp.]